MTEVALTIRSCYLAGPMRGLPEFNFPEFHKQTAWLRANGWQVFSPAERDEADEALNGDWGISAAGKGLDYFMQYDLAAVCQTSAVVVMPGWEESQGARLEASTAVEVGHPVFEIVLDETGARMLESVNPEYIRLVFWTQGPPEHVASEDCWCGPEVVTVPEEETISSGGEDDSWMPLAEYIDGVTSPYDPSLAEAGKGMPITTGVLDYFPDALLAVSQVSKAGNDKHNPGQPLHHARGKSMSHADSLVRHLLKRGGIDEETGQRHSAEAAWRALALLQQELEDNGAPLARAARLP
jgi:hypothetical protein